MKVLLIEDEAAASRRLAKLVKEIEPKAEVINEVDSIESAIVWFSENESPDLVLMDIHLADGSSFEIFNHIEMKCPVIFITAYDQYAIEAFRVNAVDYLLKPIKKAELKAAFEKYKKLQSPINIDYKAIGDALSTDKYNRRFLIRIGQTIKVVELRQAAYFYTEDKITFIVTKDGKRYPLDLSLEKLEELCDPRTFFRINRQFIVNIENIKEMYAFSKSRVKLILDPPTDQTTIVSTERSPVFKRWLTGE